VGDQSERPRSGEGSESRATSQGAQKVMSSDFAKRLGEKLKAIRTRLGFTPEQIAGFVGATDGAEIVSYENGEGDMPTRPNRQ